MPKMKTNKSAAKRFKVSGGGKIKRRKAGGRHLMTSKNSKRKRNLRQDGSVDSTDAKKVRTMIPYA